MVLPLLVPPIYYGAGILLKSCVTCYLLNLDPKNIGFDIFQLY